jgi:hypothetical protein
MLTIKIVSDCNINDSSKKILANTPGSRNINYLTNISRQSSVKLSTATNLSKEVNLDCKITEQKSS